MATPGPDRYEPTERTKVKRLAKRGVYDREVVHAILDEAFICHVGFVRDGQPFVIPSAFTRVGELLYLHGSITNGMLKTLKGDDISCCVTVTLTDGIVVARTAFHHSINYRSVVILGKARAVTDPEEKQAALEAVVEHIIPGRGQEVRDNSGSELNATAVLALELREVSAKVRTGPPIDDKKDLSLPDVWAGVLPFKTVTGIPEADPTLLPGIPVPQSVAEYRRPNQAS